MPQLDFFIFFDSTLSTFGTFFIIHLCVVGYLLPIWLRAVVLLTLKARIAYLTTLFWAFRKDANRKTNHK